MSCCGSDASGVTHVTMCVCVCVQAITDDDVDRMAMCIRVLAEQSPKMFDIFNHLCRESLSVMLTAKADEEKQFNKVSPPTKSSSTRSVRRRKAVQRGQPIAENGCVIVLCVSCLS